MELLVILAGVGLGHWYSTIRRRSLHEKAYAEEQSQTRPVFKFLMILVYVLLAVGAAFNLFKT